MSDSQQKFNKGGVPTLAFFFLIGMCLTLYYMIKNFSPRNAVAGRTSMIISGLKGGCILQVVTGLFMVFSTAQNTGITLMIIPLLGFFALHSLDQNLLVLYAALQFFLLGTISGLSDVFQAGTCVTKFGDDEYCRASWRSFLTFLAVLYHFVSLVQAISHFYFFVIFQAGPLESSSGAIYASLVHEQAQPPPATGYQGGYQGPPSFQQSSQDQHDIPSNIPQAPPVFQEKAPF
eukprot:gene6754-374_t